MADLATHLQHQMFRYKLADDERLERAEALLADLESAPEALSMANSKAELLVAAEAAGVDVDESATKAEILEALDATE